MTASISLGDMRPFGYYSDPDLALLPGIFLEICPFHPGFPVLWNFVVGSDHILNFLRFCF